MDNFQILTQGGYQEEDLVNDNWTEIIRMLRILAVAGTGSDFQQTCTPSYYNNEGKPNNASKQNSFFFGEPGEFMKILEDCRADGGMKDLEVCYRADEE